MKIIIIKDRQYRAIIARLEELEGQFPAMQSITGTVTGNRKTARNIVKNIHPEDVYVDAEKACELLRISGRTLLRYNKRYGLNHTRVSHRSYYPLSEIEMLFAQRSVAFDREIRERLEREILRLKENRTGKSGI